MTTSNKLIHYSNLNNFSNRENIGVTGNNDFLGTFGNSLEAWPQATYADRNTREWNQVLF